LRFSWLPIVIPASLIGNADLRSPVRSLNRSFLGSAWPDGYVNKLPNIYVAQPILCQNN
jgi:hypothetical protein